MPDACIGCLALRVLYTVLVLPAREAVSVHIRVRGADRLVAHLAILPGHVLGAQVAVHALGCFGGTVVPGTPSQPLSLDTVRLWDVAMHQCCPVEVCNPLELGTVGFWCTVGTSSTTLHRLERVWQGGAELERECRESSKPLSLGPVGFRHSGVDCTVSGRQMLHLLLGLGSVALWSCAQRRSTSECLVRLGSLMMFGETLGFGSVRFWHCVGAHKFDRGSLGLCEPFRLGSDRFWQRPHLHN